MSSATLIESQKFILDDGDRSDQNMAASERAYGLKYSLFYGRAGERIIGYDNESGKGDHRHYRNEEEPYAFTTFENPLSDFWRDVRREIENERG